MIIFQNNIEKSKFYNFIIYRFGDKLITVSDNEDNDKEKG